MENEGKSSKRLDFQEVFKSTKAVRQVCYNEWQLQSMGGLTVTSLFRLLGATEVLMTWKAPRIVDVSGDFHGFRLISGRFPMDFDGFHELSEDFSRIFNYFRSTSKGFQVLSPLGAAARTDVLEQRVSEAAGGTGPKGLEGRESRAMMRSIPLSSVG